MRRWHIKCLDSREAAGRVAYISTEVRLLRGGGRGQPVTVAQSLHGDHASLRYRTAPRAQHASIYRRRSPCSVCMCPHVSRQGPRARPRRTRYEFGMRGTYGAEHGPAAVDDLRLLEARQGGGILAQTQGVETVVAALHPLPGPSVHDWSRSTTPICPALGLSSAHPAWNRRPRGTLCWRARQPL
jgi:hypothetical protein